MSAPNYGKPTYRHALSRKRFRSYGSMRVATRQRKTWILGLPGPSFSYGYASKPLGDECCYDHLHRGPPFRVGGPLSLQRESKQFTLQPFKGVGNAFHEDEGEVYVNWDPGYSGLVLCGSISPASDFGATAWNKFKPGKPALDLGVALAELRQAPQLIFKRLRSMKDIANNYLAYQFGWKPLLNDIRAMVTLHRTIDKRLSQLRRDNGKGVRRGGTLWSNSSDVDENVTGNLAKAKIVGCDNFQDVILPLRVTRSTFVEERVWFSGRFRYWIPDIDSVEWESGAIRKLYGLSITPALAWELIPWSWLIDWFSNVGDVIANIDSGAVENLIAHYAFVMHERKRVSTVSCDLSLSLRLGGFKRFHLESTYTYVEKYRAGAQPYGFGVSWASLSPTQIGILIALGVTRGT